MATLKRFVCLVLVAVLSCGMVSCGDTKKETAQDVLTQIASAPGKTPLTVLTKSAFSINSFEQAVEKKFPEIDIIQVGNYTSDMGISEYEARLKNDDLTDLVMTWPLEVGEQYWADRLLDLSAFSFSGEYATSRLDDISQEGKLYYLPGPSQVRGIMYNKTLFAEKGWEVPQNFDGFVKLCRTIEDSGIRSLQLGLGNEEVLDTAFTGYGYAECFSTPEDAQWLADYNEGRGSFADQFTPALDTFQTLVDEGILKKGDLKLTYAERETMVFERRCAMIEDSVLMARRGESFNGSTDEFALMPFFNPGEGASDWARLYPVCYVGANKHLADKGNEAKYDIVLQLLEYISTPEGQGALSDDTGAMFSSLKGVNPPDIPEIQDLIPALTHGRYAIFPTLKNAQGALRLGLAGMVEGTYTKADVVKMVDEQNAAPPVVDPPAVLGKASEDFTQIETGSFIADVMKSVSGCEIALVLDNGKDGKTNGKGVGAKFYEGELTSIDIKRVSPDFRLGEVGEIWKTEMTGASLIKTLEYSLPVDNNLVGWFYYFSGLKMEFSPTAEPGSRIKSITDAQGNAIDPEKLYRVAVADYSVPEENLASCEKTSVLVAEALIEAIRSAQTIQPSKDGRFIIVEP